MGVEWNARTMGRYQRQMVLPGVGFDGQRRLLESRVLIVGAGALGSAAATYLVAAGVGVLGLVDGDTVELSNLHRQIVHDEEQVGSPKTESAAARLRAMNSDVTVVQHPYYLSRDNALDLFAQYDLIVNGSDNFPTRYLVNDAAVFTKKPLVDAAILRFEGHLAVYRPGFGCYRCLFPTPPPPGSVPDCATAGIFGAVAGVLGSMEAVEALKILLDLARPRTNTFLVYEALEGAFSRMPLRRDLDCVVCGEHPQITELVDYENFCGLPDAANLSLVGTPGVDDFSIAVKDAQRLVENQAMTIVDVRSRSEFDSSHIEGAHHCLLEDLDGLLLDETKDSVLVVCAIGVRSAYAADYLRSRGIRAWTLAGGMAAWESQRPS